MDVSMGRLLASLHHAERPRYPSNSRCPSARTRLPAIRPIRKYISTLRNCADMRNLSCQPNGRIAARCGTAQSDRGLNLGQIAHPCLRSDHFLCLLDLNDLRYRHRNKNTHQQHSYNSRRSAKSFFHTCSLVQRTVLPSGAARKGLTARPFAPVAAKLELTNLCNSSSLRSL